MWKIINGTEPQFYLTYDGSDYKLIDGLQRDFASDPTALLKLNGNYPNGSYYYDGTVRSSDTCDSDEFTVQLLLQQVPTVEAGPNDTICEGDTYMLMDVELYNYTSMTWTTNGDGTFDDEINATYTPGSGDIANDSAVLTITVQPISPCIVSAQDSMILYISRKAEITALTLQSSTDESTWTAVGGTFGAGFELCIDSLNTYYYLDVNALTSSFPMGQNYFNPFYLDETQWPTGFEAWWNAKGVNAGASGDWKEYMWKIINGQEPQFYLTYDGSDYKLIDGLMRDYASDPTALLKLNGNYPNGTYFYDGTVANVDTCESDEVTVQLKLQQVATVYAGPNDTICEDGSYDLDSAWAKNCTSVAWTHDGTGSFTSSSVVNAEYNAGTSETGTVKLKITGQPITPCTVAVSDSMELYIVAKPTAFAGDDASTCEGNPYTIADATASNYSTVTWATSGTGTFDTINILHPAYTPSHADGLAGTVTLTLYSSPNNPCTVETDDMLLTTFPLAEVDAGTARNICNIGEYVSGTASLNTSTLWTTYTGGSFDDPLALDTYYHTSSTDRTNGGVLLELFAAPENPCVALVSDQIYLTITQNSPTVFAGDDATVCADTNYKIPDASASNYLAIKWSSEGDGTYDDDEIIAPTYTMGTNDSLAGFAILKLVANPISPCTILIEDQMTLTVQYVPEAYAGSDGTICEDASKYLIQSTAAYYQSINWYTVLGTAAFDNPNILHPTYTPTTADILAGSVELCMALAPISPCTVGDTDCMTLTIQRLPIADAGADDTICEYGTYTLADATAQYYSSMTWTSNGDGSWSGDPLNATYTPGTSDKSTGSVELCLELQPINPCTTGDTDCMTLVINEEPAVIFAAEGVQFYSAETLDYCYDETITITLDEVLKGVAPFDIEWTLNSTPDDTTGMRVGDTLFSGILAPDTYNVAITAITDSNGCSVQDVQPYTLTIIVHPEPAIIFAFNGVQVYEGSDFTYCEDDTVTVTLDQIVFGTEPFDITWTVDGVADTLNNAYLNDTLFSNTLSPDTLTVQITSITDGHGCAADDVSRYNATVYIQALPTIYAGPDDDICEYESYTFSQSTGSEYASLLWFSATSTGPEWDDATILHPTYTPNTVDKIAGSVNVYVIAAPKSPCTTGDADTMLLTINPRPEITALSLNSSIDQSSWNAVDGDYGNGFELCIDSLNEYYYLDVNALTPNVALLQSYFNAFFLDETQWPTGFEAWWNAKGVNVGASAGTWQAHMWDIINGQKPQFYLTYDGSDYKLIDGLQADFASDSTALLKLNGNYPNGSYYYDGTVLSADTCESDEFTISLLLQQVPTVFAGVDATICEDATYILEDAWAKNYESVTWTTNGGGSFTYTTPYSPVNPLYTALIGENGTKELVIVAQPISPCVLSVSDTMELYISPTPIVSDVTLNSSIDQSSWTAIGGDFDNGFELCIDSLNQYYYLDVNTLNANIGLLQTYFNAFYLDETQWPTGFEAWWNAKGVNVGASGGTWQAHMWEIINGVKPQFYLTYDGTDYKLIDGLQADFASDSTALLRLNGNYPNGTYFYDGTVMNVDTCESGEFSISLLLQQVPTVYAGPNDTICEDGTYVLADAWAKNYSSVTWVGGTGSFDYTSPYSVINPEYTAGTGETGAVDLVIIGEPISPCVVAAKDTMELFIHPEPAIIFASNTEQFYSGAQLEYCYDETVTVTLDEIVFGTEPFSIAWTVNGVADSNPAVYLGDTLFTGILPSDSVYAIQITSITDDNGCSVADVSPYNMEITIHEEPFVTFAFNGQQIAQDFEEDYCYDVPIVVTIYDVWTGLAPFEICFDVTKDGQPFITDSCVTDLEALDTLYNSLLAYGEYKITVNKLEDANGCLASLATLDIYTATVTINPEPAIIFASNEEQFYSGAELEYCYDESVTITLDEILFGTEPFDIAWTINGVADNKDDVYLGDSLFSGILPSDSVYAIQITSIADSNGCLITDVSPYNAQITIYEEPAIIFAFNEVQVYEGSQFTYCETEKVTATLDEILFGLAPFDIIWTVNGTADTANNMELGDTLFSSMLSPDTYNIQITSITDENGCVVDDVSVYNAVVNIQANPTVDITPDTTRLCYGEFMDFTGLVSADDYQSIIWYTIGGGNTFAPNNMTEEPIYYPSPTIDYPQGCITIGVTVSAIDPCVTSATDFMVLCFQAPAEAFAGDDDTICEGSDYTLADATADNYESLLWTGGDGSFDNTGSLNATYTPGTGDIGNGSVELCLTAEAIDPCSVDSTDCMILTINPQPAVLFAFDGTQAFTGSEFKYCYEEIVTVTLDQIVTGTAPFDIAWELNGTADSKDDVYLTDSLFSSDALTPDTYVVNITNITDANGCSILDASIYTATLIIVPHPTVTAGPDTTICSTDVYTIVDAAAQNYSSITWATNGDGTFDNFEIVNPTYTPGANDLTTGSVELSVIVEPLDPCTMQDSDDMILSIQLAPIAEAGVNDTICEIGDYQLSGAVENACGQFWGTAGDGTFDDDELLDATYTPGTGDLAAGSVELCLTAEACDPCSVNDQDCMTLYLSELPTVEITSPHDGDVLYFNPLVEGIADDVDGDVDYVEVRVNGGSWMLATGTITWSLQVELLPCYNLIEARSFDLLGCESEIDEITVLYSTVEVPMIKGWNLISSYLQPIDADMDVVAQGVQPIDTNLTIAVTSYGKIYWPTASTNTIGNWNSMEGYKVKLKDPGSWIFRGDPTVDTYVDLAAGSFTYLPVLTNNPVPLTSVFTNPTDDIFLMYNIQSNQVYWPEGGIITITDLTPGYSYYLWMYNDATATYPAVACDPLDYIAQPAAVVNDGPWTLTRTAEVHLISIDQSAIAELDAVDFIGAFTPDGTCIGYANTTHADGNVLLTVYGDDISTAVKDGAIAGEPIQLRAYNAYTETEEVLTAYYDEEMPQSDGLYINSGISKINSFTSSTTGINNAEGLSGLISLYPNPARDEVTIVYPFETSLSNEVTIEIINADGMTVKRVMLSEESSQVDVSNLKPGVYVLRFESDGMFNVKRLVIQQYLD